MNISGNEVKLLLHKVGQFVKIANREVSVQQSLIRTYQKTAAEKENVLRKYEQTLPKVAKALYDSDFLTDDYEKREFLRKAAEDPSYLASVLMKVCSAADVAQIGSPASVAMRDKTGEEVDPVRVRAFGYSPTSLSSNLLDDIE